LGVKTVKKEIAWILALACVALVSSAAIHLTTVPSHPVYPFLGSSSTRDGMILEIVETAPEDLDNPAIKNTIEVWREPFENAENTIDIEAPYLIHYDAGELVNVYNELKAASERGVQIRILTNEPHDRAGSEIDSLSAYENIEVLEAPENEFEVHAKYFIVDGKTVFVGSQNWSAGGIQNNRELGMLIENEQLASAYTHLFETGWVAAGGAARGENFWEAEWVYPVASGSHMPTEVKNTRTVLENLIDSAARNVKVYVYVFSTGTAANQLEHALINAAEREVQVQLMFDAEYYDELWRGTPGNIDFSSRLEKLKDVERISIKLIHVAEWIACHPKVIITDGERAYVGSANWTSSSLDGRREVGVAFEDRILASALEEVFRTDWESEYARWVVAPDVVSRILLTAGGIFGVLVAILFAVTFKRRKKKKRERRRLVAELWASLRQEI
jgi:phosphatidylserine/phosphatidylglycerophosphate/cardiolipin synthase-like enzyme